LVIERNVIMYSCVLNLRDAADLCYDSIESVPLASKKLGEKSQTTG
jgi:hypothetical protein